MGATGAEEGCSPDVECVSAACSQIDLCQKHLAVWDVYLGQNREV